MQSVNEEDFSRFIEEVDAAQEKLNEAKADWIEPECNCYISGDQADASDCPLHRR